MQNAISATVAERIAGRTLVKRAADYTDEVRRLLDAALALMRERGTTSRPRVADIVAAAGLSNDAFYRHFPSKDALVAALLDDGAERLASYLAHQMAKERTPEARVRRWVQGVLSQAAPAIAETTLAVLWNGGSVTGGRHYASPQIAALLHEPFRELGSAAADLDASLAAHATLGHLSDLLTARTQAARGEAERITAFLLAGVRRSGA